MGFVRLCPLIVSVLLSASDGTVLVEREKGKGVRGKVHAKCWDRWFEGLVNEFLVGWGVVGNVLERDIVEILFEWGVVGIVLEWGVVGTLL